MRKQNKDEKKVFALPQNNTIISKDSIELFPTPQKKRLLVKPDFSPILNLENKFGLKVNGSYKKHVILEPESPVKAPNTIYLTPIKIEGKDLFGTKQENQYRKKLNFNETENKRYNLNNNITDNEMKNFFNKFNIKYYSPNNICKQKKEQNDNNDYRLKECNNRMDKDFFLIKKIKATEPNKYDEVYKVREKKTNKIFCIKKSSKKSKKNNFNTIQTIFTDMNGNKNFNELGERFCVKYIDYWIEKENYELIKEDINYLNTNLYILMEYYPLGDILDYLEVLEEKKYKFSSNFYWDIIFEMMAGLLFFHNKGYIHFDIKPTNFIVDNNGYIKLNDFGLSHKVEELYLIDDIIEGDSAYISKELFDNIDNISISNIDNRCDVFSLGLTFLEIMAKVDLPLNGKLWTDIRSDKFVIPEEFFSYCNIKDNKEFVNLIKQMISPINKRPSLIELINQYPELNKRYELLKVNKYIKSCPILRQDNTEKHF